MRIDRSNRARQTRTTMCLLAICRLVGLVVLTMSAQGAARRTKGKGHRGIYYRLDAAAKRQYEHDFYDSHGTRRWKVVGPSLKDAIASREDLQSRVRRGERVAPTKVRL